MAAKIKMDTVDIATVTTEIVSGATVAYATNMCIHRYK